MMVATGLVVNINCSASSFDVMRAAGAVSSSGARLLLD